MIYLLVPTFAKVEETKNLLNSVQKSIKKEYLVLLIDDHPEKLTLNNIDQNSNVQVLTSDKELWWVGSINLGIKTLFNNYALKADDFVIFANSDVQIDKNSFDILYDEIKRNKNQIIHPRTFDHNNSEVSSGSIIALIFPYITCHPKRFRKSKKKINMGTARFLMMTGDVLRKVGYINNDLIQYGGDNDFTLTAQRFHDIDSYIIRDAVCSLDDTLTGIKNHNIQSVKELYKSFYSIKSPNNIKFRYRLFKKFYGKIGAVFITVSMSVNTVIKFIIRKIRLYF